MKKSVTIYLFTNSKNIEGECITKYISTLGFNENIKEISGYLVSNDENYNIALALYATLLQLKKVVPIVICYKSYKSIQSIISDYSFLKDKLAKYNHSVREVNHLEPYDTKVAEVQKIINLNEYRNQLVDNGDFYEVVESKAS